MGGSSSSGMASRPVEIAATARHTATVIFLHGLGDTGHGWCEALRSIRKPHIKYVCPTASAIPVTLNAGMRMTSWFDIKGLSPNSEEDVEGIRKSSALLQQLIADEEKIGIPRNRIVVGGFSQGGAVSLFSAFTTPKSSLAGIVALSTWLPLHKQFAQEVKSNKDTPILQCHGTTDPVVPFHWGEMTSQVLKQLCGDSHELKTYQGLMHSSCEAEMKDMEVFIDKCLPQV